MLLPEMNPEAGLGLAHTSQRPELGRAWQEEREEGLRPEAAWVLGAYSCWQCLGWLQMSRAASSLYSL